MVPGTIYPPIPSREIGVDVDRDVEIVRPATVEMLVMTVHTDGFGVEPSPAVDSD